MTTALFVGRFQPFHKGHLHALKKILKKYRVLIGIGASNRQGTKENPFSYKIRREMIEKSIKGDHRIFSIPDVGNDKKWTRQILEKHDFDLVVSGNPWVRRCFKGIKPLAYPDFFEPEKYKATRIREKIRKGERWEHLVPKEVAEIIQREIKKHREFFQ